MAEYRGLTIRIDADTKRFTQALSDISRATNSAQKKLNELKRAMVLSPDTGSVKSAYFGQLQSQMGLAAAKADMLRKKMGDLESATMRTDGDRSIGELAESTDNAALSAVRAKEAYNDMTFGLANAYKQVSEISKQFGNGIVFNEKNNNLDEIRAELTEIYQLVQGAGTDKEIAALGLDPQRIDAIIEQIRRMKEAWQDSKDALHDANDVKAIEDAQIEAAKMEATLQSAARQFSDMHMSRLDVQLEEADQKVGYLATNAQMAQERFSALDDAMSIKGHGLQVVGQRFEALQTAIEASQARVDGLKSRLEMFRAAGIDKVAQGTKNLAEAADRAQKEYDEANVAVAKLEAKLSDAVRTQDELVAQDKTLSPEFDRATEDVERYTKELEEARQKAEDARVPFEQLRDAMKYESDVTGLQNAQNELEKLKSNGKAAFGELSTAAYQALQQISQYASQLVSETLQASYDLEEAYTNMLKTVDGTEAQYQQLRESALDAQLVTPVSADQILNVEALGGQLGFAIEDLEEFQRVANGLDISTNMGWEDAATNMAQFFNIMSTSPELVGNYGSAIVDLGNNFATTEASISDMAMRIAGAGATLGLSEADVLGISTALTSMGLTAEAGGSSISQIMIKIEKAVANGQDGIQKLASEAGMSVEQFVSHVESLDNEALNEFAKQYGMTGKQLTAETTEAYKQLQVWAETAGYSGEEAAKQFAEAWKDAPIEALQRVFAGMSPEKLANDNSNLSLLLEDLGISTIRQSDVARRLANNSDLLTEAVKASNEAWEENVALDVEVERRNESLSGRMDVLRNSLTRIKTELGEGLSPLVEFAITNLGDVIDMFDSMSDGMKTGIIGGAGVVTGLAGGIAIFTALKGPIEGVVAAFEKLGGLSAVTGWFASMGTVTTVGALGSVFGALAIAVGLYFKSVADHKKTAEEFGRSLEDLSSTTDRLNESISIGSSAFKGFEKSFPKTLSVSELTAEIDEFNRTTNETFDSVGKSNGMLGQYKDVIDRLAGRGEASAEDMAVLEWAVKNLNDTLGTNFTAQDVLMGKYKDEEMEIDNLMGYIDRLIEKRQLQAEMDAAQGAYTSALEKQMELEDNAAAAREKYNSALEVTKQSYLDQDANWFSDRGLFSDADIEKWLLANGEATDGLQRLREEMIDAQVAADRMTETTQAARDRMEGLTVASAEYDMLADSFINKSFGWGEALDKAGISTYDLVKALQESGIGVEELQKIYDDTSVYFANMVEESGGDIDKLIEIIQKYNDTHIDKKELKIEAKAAQDEVTSAQDALDRAQSLRDGFLNGGSGDVESVITVTAVDEASPVLEEVGGKAESLPPAEVTISANSSGFMNTTKDCTRAANGIKQDYPTQLTADGSQAQQEAATTQSYIDGLHDKNINIFLRLHGAEALNSVLRTRQVTVTENAAGGLIYHADGYIASRPTWLTSRDIVGEAGAEAVIPLTNRRYTRPFADTVAEQMLSRLDGMGNSTVVEVNLNYTAGDDANQMARDLSRSLSRIMNARR